MEERKIWANAVLKDEKLIFWWTGDKCNDVEDFYKDFYFSGLKMIDEIQTGRYRLVQKEISEIRKDDVEFYKNFLIHECFKGLKPY